RVRPNFSSAKLRSFGGAPHGRGGPPLIARSDHPVRLWRPPLRGRGICTPCRCQKLLLPRARPPQLLPSSSEGCPTDGVVCRHSGPQGVCVVCRVMLRFYWQKRQSARLGRALCVVPEEGLEPSLA